MLDRLRDGALRLLYVAPERFANARFMRAVASAEVDLLVVDEAHCLSEWGHDFRPDYGRLAGVRHALGDPPTMALTATATPRVAIDIARRLRLRDPVEVRTGFDRPNLTFDVLDGPGDRTRGARRSTAGLAEPERAARRSSTRARAARSRRSPRGSDCLVYHAGLAARRAAPARRRRSWPRDDAVIACTNAFGMGVDKPDVRIGLALEPARLAWRPTTRRRAARAATAQPARAVLLYAPLRPRHHRPVHQRGAVRADRGGRLLDALRRRGRPRRPGGSELSRRPTSAGNADGARAWLAAAEAVGAVELEPRLRRRDRAAGSTCAALGRRAAAGNEQRARAVERMRWEQLTRSSATPRPRRAAASACCGTSATARAGPPIGRCCDVHEPPHRRAAARPAARARRARRRRRRDRRAPRNRPSAAPASTASRGASTRTATATANTRCSASRPASVHPRCAPRSAPPWHATRLASTEGRYPLLLPPGTRSAPRRSGRAGPHAAAPAAGAGGRHGPRPARTAAQPGDGPRPRPRRSGLRRRERPGARRHRHAAAVRRPPACSRAAASAARSSRATASARARDGRRRPDVRPAESGGRAELAAALPGRIPDDRECRADSGRTRWRRDAHNPAGLDRRPACCRRRAIARREHERVAP